MTNNYAVMLWTNGQKLFVLVLCVADMYRIIEINQRTGKRRPLPFPLFSCEDAAERFAIRWTLIGPRGFGYIVRYA